MRLGDGRFLVINLIHQPELMRGFADAQRRFGPVSALPTPIFFYGMQPGQEINVEIERGKILVIHLTALGETEDDGSVRLFFELNGQPRIITIADRKSGAAKKTRRIADPADDRQLAAPMPGLVSVLSVTQGQQVKAGDLLLTLEAMKMETAIIAPRDGTIAELAVKAGQAVDAKELLLAIE
jgi:pyruvate carboxylase